MKRFFQVFAFIAGIFMVACDDSSSASGENRDQHSVDTLYVFQKDTVELFTRDTVLRIDTLVVSNNDTVFNIDTLKLRESCELDDQGAIIHVVCDSLSFDINKATCSGEPYDPETAYCEGGLIYHIATLDSCGELKIVYDTTSHFCYENKVYEKCGGKIYNPDRNSCFEIDGIIRLSCGDWHFNPEVSFCSGGLVYDKCNGTEYKPRIEACVNGNVYGLCNNEFFDRETHFCRNDGIYEKCNGKTFKANESCVDGKVLGICGELTYDAATHFCIHTMAGLDTIVELCDGMDYSLDWTACVDGVLMDLCGGKPYDRNKQECFNGEIFDVIACGIYTLWLDGRWECNSDKVVALCNGIGYDPSLQYCTTNASLNSFGKLVDERDEMEYRTVKVGSQEWMAEDLQYITSGVMYTGILPSNCWLCDASSFNTVLYSSDHLASAICPEGWHVPTKSEWQELMDELEGSSVLRKWAYSYQLYGDHGFSLGRSIDKRETDSLVSYGVLDSSSDSMTALIVDMNSGMMSFGNDELAAIRCVKNKDP